MIQVVTYSGRDYRYNSDSKIDLHSFKNARSLEEYDVNVIDLSAESLWKNRGNDCTTIDAANDFESLARMIYRAENTKILLVLPQNVTYSYHFCRHEYLSAHELKDMLKYLSCPLLSMIYLPFENVNIEYEITRTNLEGKDFDAAFFFPNEDGILKSSRSNRATAIKLNHIWVTSLAIDSVNDLFIILRSLSLISKTVSIPKWLKDFQMFDDNLCHTAITESEKVIAGEVEKIREAKEKLDQNMYFKSILISSGDELVQVVFDILEELFGCDLSTFTDEKKEDFIFEYEGMVYIGEIKGVNHNVKNENVSQLDVHYQGYLEDHPEKSGNVKPLLIMNYQKNKDIQERELIKDTQIKLAERNGSLIIDSLELLNVLDQYRKGILSREDINTMFSSQIGVLKSNRSVIDE